MRKIHSIKYSIEIEYFIGARVCNNLPIDVKDSKSIEHFKSKLRSVLPLPK